MTSMTEEQKLIPADTRGRVRVPKARREALLDEFERSGMSGAKFAQLAGVKYPTFANWVQRRRKAKAEAAGLGKPIAFAEAIVDIDPARTVITRAGLFIELPGGGRVVVDSPIQLQMAAELLRLMAAKGSRPC